jgi:carbon storage regulator CsrA
MSLVLIRKSNECVLVGDTLIKVGEIKGNRVKLIFDGPFDVKIIRAELLDKNKKLDSENDG